MNNVHEITDRKIRELTDTHLVRYNRMVAAAMSGNPAIRISECSSMISIWESVASKGYKWSELNTREQQEVFEAYDDDLQG